MARDTPRPAAWRLAVPTVCACAGLLATTSMVNAQGTDLRPGRYTDLIGLVGEQRDRVQDLRRQIRGLEADVNSLTRQVTGARGGQLQRAISRAGLDAGVRGLTGPGLSVTLDDAPLGGSVPPGTDPNLLVVHQQDLQAVVNALWAGGAEGISLQGQRIISTTGVKCVGNTVVLQGVPYSPPYRIVAVGQAHPMYAALLASQDVQNYRDYVGPPYDLRWALRTERQISVPAYGGPLALQYATPVVPPPTGTGG